MYVINDYGLLMCVCVCVSASTFSQVVSTSLGAYQMQMGPLTFEVLSGDITRETCDVIINSTNGDFTLKSGDCAPEPMRSSSN